MELANKNNIQRDIVSTHYSDGKTITNRIVGIINMNTSEILDNFEELLLKDFFTVYIDTKSINYYKMFIFNRLLNLYGVESFKHFEYINSGDIYNTTIISNIDTGKFYIGAIGDIMEKE